MYVAIAIGKSKEKEKVVRQPKRCLSISISKKTLCVISGSSSVFSSAYIIRKGKSLLFDWTQRCSWYGNQRWEKIKDDLPNISNQIIHKSGCI